ncbi:hypothetical protein H696_05958 [Fonticula alba]|uniref:Secreted protein n=1 Tax=Fonticula alba TaxID=691883 RepID=A0A058Z2B5_FONAL|nr:hypothetical protein H696_05958 [Fonticula alba]KCV67662.1 hypothetical protein H696_05958 [Fonticula alba]|eukprot:XP_009498000.1 hypothetical protein H696_05958 [Fonticula alba]
MGALISAAAAACMCLVTGEIGPRVAGVPRPRRGQPRQAAITNAGEPLKRGARPTAFETSITGRKEPGKRPRGKAGKEGKRSERRRKQCPIGRATSRQGSSSSRLMATPHERRAAGQGESRNSCPPPDGRGSPAMPRQRAPTARTGAGDTIRWEERSALLDRELLSARINP